MKKAMLFIVALLFSVTASAGSMILNTSTDSSASGTASISPYNTLSSLHGDSGTFIKGTAIQDEWKMTTTGAPSSWDFVITSNLDADPFAASINGGVLPGVNLFTAVNGVINFTYTFLTDASHSLKIFGVANKQAASSSYDININEVPVPAALFLFAPALLGFLGLRRKATLAA